MINILTEVNQSFNLCLKHIIYFAKLTKGSLIRNKNIVYSFRFYKRPNFICLKYNRNVKKNHKHILIQRHKLNYTKNVDSFHVSVS